VYFVLLAAAIAILAGVVVIAMGRGGEMVRAYRDLPMGPPVIRSATDVAMLRLPIAPFGYHEQVADAALDAVAAVLAERDTEIAGLREELRWLRAERQESTSAVDQNSDRSVANAVESLEAQLPQTDAQPWPAP